MHKPLLNSFILLLSWFFSIEGRSEGYIYKKGFSESGVPTDFSVIRGVWEKANSALAGTGVLVGSTKLFNYKDEWGLGAYFDDGLVVRRNLPLPTSAYGIATQFLINDDFDRKLYSAIEDPYSWDPINYVSDGKGSLIFDFADRYNYKGVMVYPQKNASGTASALRCRLFKVHKGVLQYLVYVQCSPVLQYKFSWAVPTALNIYGKTVVFKAYGKEQFRFTFPERLLGHGVGFKVNRFYGPFYRWGEHSQSTAFDYLRIYHLP